MKVTGVQVSAAKVHSFGDHSNIKPQVSFSVDIDEDDNFLEVTDALQAKARQLVNAEIDRALEERDEPPLYYQGVRFSLLEAAAAKIVLIIPDAMAKGLSSAWRHATQDRLHMDRNKFGRRFDWLMDVTEGERYWDWDIVVILDNTDIEKLPPIEWFTTIEDPKNKVVVIMPGRRADLPKHWDLLEVSEEVGLKQRLLDEIEADKEEWPSYTFYDGTKGELPPFEACRAIYWRSDEGNAIVLAPVEIPEGAAIPEHWRQPGKFDGDRWGNILVAFGDVTKHRYLSDTKQIIDCRDGDFSKIIEAAE